MNETPYRSCEDHQSEIMQNYKANQKKKQKRRNNAFIFFIFFVCVALLKWKQPFDFQMSEEKNEITDQSLKPFEFNKHFISLVKFNLYATDFYLVIVEFTPTVKARIFFSFGIYDLIINTHTFFVVSYDF